MRGTTALVTVTMLLGGCASGAAEPASTTFGAVEPSAVVSVPSPDVSVEADDTLRVRPPEMPALAREQTPEGAVAFAEWWFDTLNYATVTGDTSGLADASDPQCETCASYIAEIDGAYADGGSMEGGVISVSGQPMGPIQKMGVEFPVFAEVSATTFLNSSGDEVASFESGSTVLSFTAHLVPGGWKAGGLDSGDLP